MPSPSDILGYMQARADEQINGLTSSIGQVDEQIDGVEEEIDGVENGLCGVAETDMTDYLNNTKLAEIEALYGDPFNTPFSMNYGPNYGTIDYTTGGISDFTILDVSGTVMYEYLGTNWDSDPDITKWIGDYAFGNDYLTRPLTSGASYGLYDNLSGLNSAKSLLTQDKNKITASKAIFEDYK